MNTFTMDLDDIRLFVKVAEHKSFVRAATELRIQTSLVSRRVARLEATLGVRLLQRTTRKVSLTEEGSQFLADSSRGLEHLSTAIESLNSAHGVPKGKVRVSSSIELGQYLIDQVMPDFISTYPEIQLEWDLIADEKSMVEKSIDLSIRPFRSHEQGVIEKVLGVLQIHLYRSPTLDLTLPKKPTLEDIEKLPWIVFTRGQIDSQRVKFPLEMGGISKEIKPHQVRFRTNSLNSVRDLLIRGLGVGLLPVPVAEAALEKGQLVRVLPNYLTVPDTIFYVTYPSREYLPPKVRVLIDWLTSKFPFQAKR